MKWDVELAVGWMDNTWSTVIVGDVEADTEQDAYYKAILELEQAYIDNKVSCTFITEYSIMEAEEED